MNLKKIFHNQKLLGSVLLLAVVFTGCKKAFDVDVPAQQELASNQSSNFVPNELLVKFKEGVSDEEINKALAVIQGKVIERLLTKAMISFGDKSGLYLVNTPMKVPEAIEKIQGTGKMRGYLKVAFAEPNFIYQHDAVSSDPYFTNGSLWGLNGTYGCQADDAWAAGHTGAASVFVGIIDEGIQFTHPDLSGQVWTNPYDVANGVDDDKNGYIDDVHGWDFAANDNSVYDGGTNGRLDDHGTHVAGTIGAKNNGVGVVGVNWAVTLVSAKFLGRNGGTTANAIKAVDYLTDLKTRHGVKMVASNNSWGGGGYSQALYDAVNRSNSANILFIAAAGNGGSDGVGDNNDVTASYPSNYNIPNVISVASITSSGAKSSFSNYGATTVDLGAPGSGIYSTTAYNTLSSYSGTSMATPHVSGAAALYASTHPGATAAEIRNAILTSVVPTASLSGKCVTGGRLNVAGF